MQPRLQQYIGLKSNDRSNEQRRPVDNPSNISKLTTVSEQIGRANLWGIDLEKPDRATLN